MQYTWISSLPQENISESHPGLVHFINNALYDPNHKSPHSVLDTTTKQWIHCNSDEECIPTMQQLYTKLVQHLLPATTPGGYFGMGLSHCPYSQKAKHILQNKDSHYIDLQQRIPNYMGTYPIIFWCGSAHDAPTYLGGCSDFEYQLLTKEHHSKELVHELQKYVNKYISPSEHLSSYRYIVSIKGSHVEDRTIRHLLKESKHVIIRPPTTPDGQKDMDHLIKEFNLPSEWYIDLSSKKPKILPLHTLS